MKKFLFLYHVLLIFPLSPYLFGLEHGVLGVRIADLRTEPMAMDKNLEAPALSQDVGPQLSQILFGEKLLIDPKKSNTDWYYAGCVNQEILNRHKKRVACTGFVQKNQVIKIDSFPVYNIVLQDLWTKIYPEKNEKSEPIVMLPFGTMLDAARVDTPWWHVTFLGTSFGYLKESPGIYELTCEVRESEEFLRNRIVELAKKFIRCPYVFGGRSPHWPNPNMRNLSDRPDSNEHDLHEQRPNGHCPDEQSPNRKNPSGQSPNEQNPKGQDSKGRGPFGPKNVLLDQNQKQITGTDCSGLVNLVFKAVGLQIPKNSKSQYRDLPKKISSGQELKPGDLLFFGNWIGQTTHVMLYLGNDQIIESTGRNISSKRYAAQNNVHLSDLGVRIIDLKEYIGVPADQIRSGKTMYKKRYHVLMGSYLNSDKNVQQLRSKLLDTDSSACKLKLKAKPSQDRE